MNGRLGESGQDSRATLSDIAREAGVSVATASRTLNGSAHTVAAATRVRVEEAAARLGYEANVTAQAVGRGLSPTVALVVRNIEERYFARIAHGVIKEAAASGIAVTVTATDSYPGAQFDRLRSLRGQRPGGLIVIDPPAGGEQMRLSLLRELDAYQGAGIPVVTVGSTDLGFPSVVFADQAGAAALGDHLVRQGYRRPLLLTSTVDWPAHARRTHAVAGVLSAAGMEPCRIEADAATRDGGRRALAELPDPVLRDADVVVCANDALAFGAASGLRSRGVCVGGEIAVCGFEDIPGALDVRPALTTVRLPLIDAGAQAFRLAFTAGSQVREMVLDAELCVRDSTPVRRP
ncbi:LacI family DNA-binding transcriptional regulator [Streptomyces solaniscabiei]|uniref:LacI family DNA-binding transcriptional regulator n=1 Tax=Streptomyces solaniscabiei TaxID=2683255 RepID=UPI001CE324CC|nr:LacI family DNA-binding transcriptional regulator [Streptomyces solaniscabiei]